MDLRLANNSQSGSPQSPSVKPYLLPLRSGLTKVNHIILIQET